MKLAILFGMKIVLCVSAVHAKPFIPESMELVIMGQAQWQPDKKIAALYKQHKSTIDDVRVVDKLATAYIETARQKADPRYFGYAKALLTPYLMSGSRYVNDITLLLHWADIQQFNHQFDAAMDTLNQILSIAPNNASAHLMRASIWLVKGDYAKALSDCTALIGQASMLVITSCVAQVKGNSGWLETSYETLSKQLKIHKHDNVLDKAWAYSILADMAMRLGKLSDANGYFITALKLKANDYYLLGAYADLLLRLGRNQAVTDLLSDYLHVDALLLRFCLAKKQSVSVYTSYKNQLQKRYQASEKRGDLGHLRDRANFLLNLKNDPKAALKVAKLNWQYHKEPADALILLSCAVANEDRVVLATLTQWRRNSGYENKFWDEGLAWAI